MTLVLPKYIEESGVVGAPVTYTWDKNSYDNVVLKPNFPLNKKIHEISYRAEIALALGFAEWVAWRLSKETPDQTLLNFIEAVWAGAIDFKYIRTWKDLDDASWQGPGLRPILETYQMLIQVVHLNLQTDQFAHDEVVCISRIAEHVMPDVKVLKNWQKTVLDRMEKYHPYEEGNPLGSPVSREILDPDFEYDPSSNPSILNSFLESLDPSTNPFLASEQELKARNFEGEAYKYKV